MSEWKKIVTSGSDASLADVSVSGTLLVHPGDGDAIKIGVDGEVDSSIKFYDDDAESSQHFKMTFNANNRSLRFQSDNLDNILFLQESGNVGIGTPSATDKLTVDGVVSASGGNSSNWNTAYGWGDHANAPYITTANSTLTIITSMTTGFLMLTNTPTVPPSGHIHLGRSSNKLRMYSQHGYLDMGCENTSWAHFYTDRAKFYFNKSIVADGGMFASYNEDLILRRDHDDSSYNQIKIETGTVKVTLANKDRLTINDDDIVEIGRSSAASTLRINCGNYGAGSSTADSAIVLDQNGTSNTWRMAISNQYGTPGALYIEEYNTDNGIKILKDGGYADSFTGFHRATPESPIHEYLIGSIVSSTGILNNPNLTSNMPTVSEAVPMIEVSTIPNDKKVFGVVAKIEYSGSSIEDSNGSIVSKLGICDEDRILVNSMGEGSVLVCNYSGSIDNGDYVTTSPIAGLGMKQSDDLLHNYTVAKLTQDCNFDLASNTYECQTFEHSGSTYRKALVACTYHCG